MTESYRAATCESIEGPFLRVARRASLCDDDAWEALARGFEIALRHRERIRPDTAAAWFAAVVHHAMDAGRGDGGRYRRIMRATGWSYAKVNRCLSEGRAALRALLLPGGAVVR